MSKPAADRLEAALERIGASQFGRVTDGLAARPDRDTGVHEARKALKRLRALLRIARPFVPKPRYRALDVRLRDLGRALAPLRDARVSLDTLDSVDPAGCPALRSRLEERRAAAEKALFDEPGEVERLGELVEAATREWSETIGAARVESPDGMRRVHRRGCKRYAAVVERGRARDFHEWRKEVKHLRYQFEALQQSGWDGLGGSIELLVDLGETLGDEHDLTVLAALVEKETGCDDEQPALLALLRERRAALRTVAIPAGDEVFGTGAQRFATAVGLIDGSKR